MKRKLSEKNFDRERIGIYNAVAEKRGSIPL